MATVRAGNKAVLMVVDVQVGVMREAWDAARIIGNISQAVARARSLSVPVIWVQHSNEEMPPDSTDWQLVPELKPAADEPVVHKQFGSSFEQTTLEDELRKRGATHIALAGAETNWCIRATAYGALDRGYDLTLIKDAHTAAPLALGNGEQVEVLGVINDLNTTMTRLRYPGRINATATAAQVDFGAPGGAAQLPTRVDRAQ
jgi:nicotinamidase-related amidase